MFKRYIGADIGLAAKTKIRTEVYRVATRLYRPRQIGIPCRNTARNPRHPLKPDDAKANDRHIKPHFFSYAHSPQIQRLKGTPKRLPTSR